MPLRLTSTAFRQGGDIPKKYTCDGDNVSPPFAWSGAPEGTRSFLLICDDPDAPAEIFHHWAAFDIPPDWRGLKEGHGAESLTNGFRQAINDFGQAGLLGSLSAARRQATPLSFPAECAERGVAACRPFSNMLRGHHAGDAICFGIRRTRRLVSALDET